MQKVSDYIILWTSTIGKMEEQVNRYIERGYRPYGGIAISDTKEFYQAMVLYKE